MKTQDRRWLPPDLGNLAPEDRWRTAASAAQGFSFFLCAYLGALFVNTLKTLEATRRTAEATRTMLDSSEQTAVTLRKMREEAIADAREAAAREAVMLRWTVAGVVLAGLAFLAAAASLALGLG